MTRAVEVDRDQVEALLGLLAEYPELTPSACDSLPN